MSDPPHREPVFYQPIGVVRSPFTTLAGMPLQTVAARDVRGRIELDPRYAPGLRDLDGAVLHVEGLDLIDGTPVLDLKPFVPAFDNRETDRIGWFGGKTDRVFELRADDRFEP